jgi:hypothetical protein
MILSFALTSYLLLALDSPPAALLKSAGYCEAAALEVSNTIREMQHAQFDQADGQGWRKLWNAKCYHASARLIESYSAAHRELTDQERQNLQFHSGQSFAFSGNSDAAIAALEQCFRPEEEKNGFRWNTYLRGTIAFVNRDKAQLISARDELSANANNYGNAINLKVLSSLFESFDDSYAIAYSKPRR